MKVIFADGLSNIKIRSTVYFIGAISKHVLLLNCQIKIFEVSLKFNGKLSIIFNEVRLPVH